MRQTITTYDWAEMIVQLRACGQTDDQIAKAMETPMTRRMVTAYRNGAQPLYYRGSLLLAAWCRITGKPEAEAPRAEVIRGHRVDRRLIVGPQVKSLPQWPPAAPVTIAVKKRRRPRKVAA